MKRRVRWLLSLVFAASLMYGAAQSAPDGSALFSSNCAACHGDNGQGAVGPALAGDANLADPDFHIRQILRGGNVMPPFAQSLSDDQIAAIATFERTSWQNQYGAVTAAQVATVRAGGSALSVATIPQASTQVADAAPVAVSADLNTNPARLVTGTGMTLYLFFNDSLTGTSHCETPCSTHWKALTVAGAATAGPGVTATDLGTVKRADGSLQVTYRGWPLYTSPADTKPGDALGTDLSGMWDVATPGVANVAASLTAPVAAPAAPGGGETPTATTNPPVTPIVYQGTYEPVTDARLRQPAPGEWLMYKRTYDLQAYSPLNQITTENIGDLVPVWSFGTGVSDGHEAPPILNGGLMFVTAPFSNLFALDARTGDLVWKYQRSLPADVAPEVCCGMVNRGVALYGDKVYMATLDSHLLAFEATTGEIVWDVTVEDYLLGYAMTLAPLAVNGKILVGASGGEYGIRGFVAAYDSETGAMLWKTHTIPGPGEPGNETWPGDTWRTGGGSIWVTGSYDPDTNLTYWGTGNGSPWMGVLRPGDNLHVSSVVAFDADTGEIRASYQYVPNDTWDYDEISDQTLVNVVRDGVEVKGLIHAARSGHFYLLDRTDLSFEYGVPYMEAEPQTITGFEADGRPIIPDDHRPGIGESVEVCPGLGGPNNWYGLAFSPDTGYAYVPTSEVCMTLEGVEPTYLAGQTFSGANFQTYVPDGFDWAGALQAIDVATGEVVWKHKQQMPVRSPAMVTAGGLVFQGDIYDRELRAFDAKTGEIVWRFKTNSSVIGVPVTFELDGVQYVAVQAGYGAIAAIDVAGAAAQFGVPFNPVSGGAVWVFALKSN